MLKVERERKAFFADLSKHSLRDLLDRFRYSTPDEICGEPGREACTQSSRPIAQGGLVHEIRRRLEAGLIIEKERP